MKAFLWRLDLIHMVFILILFLLSGCSSMGDWLSGSIGSSSSGLVYPAKIPDITIGVTTQQGVRAVFGTPTDLQSSTLNGTLRETWAYATASPSINPFQYLPLVGAIVLPSDYADTSFSVSFSSHGIVDGISVRDFQPYGGYSSGSDRFEDGFQVLQYGTINPAIYHLNEKFSLAKK